MRPIFEAMLTVGNPSNHSKIVTPTRLRRNRIESCVITRFTKNPFNSREMCASHGSRSCSNASNENNPDVISKRHPLPGLITKSPPSSIDMSRSTIRCSTMSKSGCNGKPVVSRPNGRVRHLRIRFSKWRIRSTEILRSKLIQY